MVVSLMDRQPHFEARITGLRRYSDVPVMARYDGPLRDLEPEPSALSRWLCRHERLEDLIPDLFGNTQPRIRHRDDNFLACKASGYRQHPGSVHCVQCIV